MGRPPEETDRVDAADPRSLLAAMPFAAGLGVRIDAAGPEEVQGVLDWAPERCTAGGLLHGGALMALADSLGAVCAYLNLPPGAGTATTTSSTTFLRGVRRGSVTGTARPLNVGRTQVAVQTELRDEAGRLVAHTVQTQAVLAPVEQPAG